MTEEQILLVKKTWKIFRSIDPVLVGSTFYGKLFNENPSLRKMFPADMGHQYRKLMDMISTIAARLDHIDDLKKDIVALGKRHVQYGVKPVHYQLVGNALLWTLEQGLGKDWTPEVQKAWAECYASLSGAMLGGSFEAPDQ